MYKSQNDSDIIYKEIASKIEVEIFKEILLSCLKLDFIWDDSSIEIVLSCFESSKSTFLNKSGECNYFPIEEKILIESFLESKIIKNDYYVSLKEKKLIYRGKEFPEFWFIIDISICKVITEE